MDTSQLTHEDIERMRALLAAHDRDQTGKIKEFDLNNPPRQPYSYQEFPRLIYNHDTRQHKAVHSARELDAHLDAGWSKDPYPAEPVVDDPKLSAEDAAEAAEIDARLKKKKKAQ